MIAAILFEFPLGLLGGLAAAGSAGICNLETTQTRVGNVPHRRVCASLRGVALVVLVCLRAGQFWVGEEPPGARLALGGTAAELASESMSLEDSEASVIGRHSSSRGSACFRPSNPRSCPSRASSSIKAPRWWTERKWTWPRRRQANQSCRRHCASFPKPARSRRSRWWR